MKICFCKVTKTACLLALLAGFAQCATLLTTLNMTARLAAGRWFVAIVLLCAAGLLTAQTTFTNVTAMVGLPLVGNSALAWGDYDNDGRLDLLQGGTVWRNTESGFTNVTASLAPSLPGLNGDSMWVDYDGDGRLDFLVTGYRYISNYYARVSELWRNTGDGFTNVTATVLPGLPLLWDASVAWVDYDNDGRLDFFLTGSFVSQIWRNTGSNFVDVTAAVAPGLRGVADGSVAWGDYDHDGRVDFIITGGIPRRNDLDDDYPYYTAFSQIWRNTGNGFVDVTATVAPGLPGAYWSSVAWGDYDNDGRLDFLLSGYNRVGYNQTRFAQLWRNTGNGFADVTASVAPGLTAVLNGAVAWGDYDHDGRLDILLSGFLLRNTGSGFIKTTATDAPGLSKLESSSLAWGDYDNDGRLDFVLSGLSYFCYFDCDESSPSFLQLWKNNIPQTNPLPAVITESPAILNQTSVEINARINPRGQAVTAWFVWGDTTNYGHVTAAQPMGNGPAFNDFSQAITGLSTGVTYYCRAVGSNDQGEVFFGHEQHFLLSKPYVTTRPGSSVSPASATFNGLAYANNLPAYGWFEWGLTPAYGQVTPVQFLGSGFVAGFGENVFGLAGSTTYYFRAVASNGLGVAYGAGGSLITPVVDVCPGYISPTSRSFGSSGGANSVYILLGCNWNVINTNSWITITSSTNGSPSGSSFAFTVATNSDSQLRRGNITIGGRNLLVTQGGAATQPPGTNVSCTYYISPAGVNHGYGASMETVYVGAPTTCAWTVSVSNSWITILSSASGVGSSEVDYAVEANTGTSSRSGNITIGDRNYAITQAGHTDVSLPADQVVALDGTATFSVTVNVAPPFTYQWQFNGVDLADGAGVSGATTATLVLTGVQYSQGGHYRVVVRNAVGTFNSSSATLTVAPTSHALPLDEALDTGDLFFWKTWSDSRGIWFGQTNTTHDGLDALESSGLTPGAYASLAAKSGGPGMLSFWWKTAFATPSDRLQFWIGSSQSATLSNTMDWAQRTFMVLDDVDLRWTFANSSTGEQSRAWLDQVQFTPCDFRLSPSDGDWVDSFGGTRHVTLTAAAHCPWQVVNTNFWITILSSVTNNGSGMVNYAVAANPAAAYRSGNIIIADQNFFITQYPKWSTNSTALSLAEALDTTGALEWSTIGTPEWFGQAVISRDGSDAAQSGPVGPGAAVTATTAVNGPGTVYFWWKVSSETNKDYLKFFINGAQQTRISGEVDWQWLSYNLLPGSNVLKWTYSKNDKGTVGNDRGWLDQVQFVPTPETGLCAVAVSPMSANLSPNWQTGLVQVAAAAGCGWNVVNTNSWITYGAFPGESNGFVRYTVSTNDTRNQRTGVLLIGGRPFTVTQSGGLSPCSYYISQSTINFGPAASTGQCYVWTLSDCAWSVLNTNAWITITSSLTNSNNGNVAFSVAQNTSLVTRSGQIRIAGQIVTVNQRGAMITLAEALDTVGTSLGWDNNSYNSWIGEGNVTHDGVDAAQSASLPDNASSGLYTTVNGPGTLSFWWKVSSETNYDTLRFYLNGVEQARLSGEVDWQPRSLTLPAGSQSIQWSYTKDTSIATGQDRGWVDQVQFVPISGCPATLSPSNASHSSTASTGLVSVAIASGCPWGVSNPNSWISIVSGSGGTGNGSVTYLVAANPSTYARNGNIQIADKIFAVTQSGITIPPSNCTYTVSPSGISSSSAPFTGAAFVNAPSSCEWNVQNTNDWIVIASSLTNAGTGQVNFSVLQNSAPVARSAQIRVAGQIVTVNQSAAPAGCLVTLSPGSGSHSSNASTGSVSVAAASGCAWVVFNTNSWISILLVSNGTGNGSVTYTTEANPAASVRSGNIQIGDKNFLVTQSGYTNPPTNCTVAILPSSRTHSYGAATNTVAVTAGASCAWSVANTNSWIDFVSGTSGTGNGTVTYSISANSSTNARSGNFQIVGLNFALTQSGTPGGGACTSILSATNRTHSFGSATGLVSVTTTAGCAWTAVESNTWVSIIAGFSGTSNGVVRYLITANTNSTPRTGDIYIAGQTITLTQLGKIPTIRLHGLTVGGGAMLSVDGNAGRTNVVECSADLVNWYPISTNSLPGTITDSTGTNAPRRFYRSYELP